MKILIICYLIFGVIIAILYAFKIQVNLPFNKEKVISGLLVLAYLILIIMRTKSVGGANIAFILAIRDLIIPMAFIWFGDDLAAVTGDFGMMGKVNAPSPAWLLKLLSWIVLIIYIGFGLYSDFNLVDS